MLIQKPFSFKEDGFCNIQTGRKNFMDIRLAENKDLPEIMEIYAYAREFMKTVGKVAIPKKKCSKMILQKTICM